MTTLPPLRRSRIVGTGHYLPSHVVTNDDLGKQLDATDDWIYERTGIHLRHIAADDQVTSDLAVIAVNRALAMAGCTSTDIDLLVLATITPDMPAPACAAFVSHKLGMRHVMAFDVTASSAGFIYALSVADQFLRSRQCTKAVVVGVELLSRVVDWTDRGTSVLFGDGAGAVVLEACEPGSPGEILSTRCYMDGSAAWMLNIPGGGSKHPPTTKMVDAKLHTIHMHGPELFKLAIKSLTTACKSALDHEGLTPDQVAWVISHQANRRIIHAVANRVGVPPERCYINLDRVGNTSAASLPIALDEANRAELLRRDSYLLMCALGAGVAWGSAVVRW